MFNKIMLCVSAVALCVSAGLAQTSADEYKKNEFYVGYSYQHSGRTSLNGAEGSVVRNFNRYVGVKGDFSIARGERTETGFADVGGTLTSFRYSSQRRVQNFLGGIQIKDNATKSRWKPFAHALIGVGVGRFTNTDFSCPSANICNGILRSSDRETGFSAAFGGGLDIRVNKKIDIRIVQIDYNPVRFYNRFYHNTRFGIGIVFH